MLYISIILILIKNLNGLAEENKPTIQEISSSKLIENKPANLICQIGNGKQPIAFEWLKDGKEIKLNDEFDITNLKESSILNIKAMTYGKLRFDCLAKNEYGLDKKSIFLNLNCKYENSFLIIFFIILILNTI